MRLLFVCTGNLCRSPIAERLTTMWARELLGDQAVDVHVSSAGLSAPPSNGMDPRSAAALRTLGGNDQNFRSRKLTTDMAVGADLVLTMTRTQRRTVLERTPRGLRRTFTLLEAADLLGKAELAGLGQVPLHERAEELGLRLDAARMHRTSRAADDVADPIGQRSGVHREVANTIAAALRPLAAVLFAEPSTLAGSTARNDRISLSY